MAGIVRTDLGHIKTIIAAHTVDTYANTIYVIAGHPVVAVNTKLANVTNVFVTDGFIEYPKIAEDIANFDTVYFDATVTLKITDNATDGATPPVATIKCGFAWEIALTAAATILIKLDSSLVV